MLGRSIQKVPKNCSSTFALIWRKLQDLPKIMIIYTLQRFSCIQNARKLMKNPLNIIERWTKSIAINILWSIYIFFLLLSRHTFAFAIISTWSTRRSGRLRLQKHMVVNCYRINALQCILRAQKITEPGQLKSERPIWQTKNGKKGISTERTAANARQTLSLSKCTANAQHV